MRPCFLGRVRLLLLCCAVQVSMAAGAQEARPVRLVVPAPAGGSIDVNARLLARHLAVITGEPHVVENRPGANTNIGSEHVARSAPDGRTLLVAGATISFNHLLNKGAVVPLQDLLPVVQLTHGRYVLVVTQSLPVTTLAELQQLAASRPGGLNCAAVPGPTHIACEQLRQRFGGTMVSVPFAGIAPALNALSGGHVDLMFLNTDAALRPLESGRIRLLARSDAQTLPAVAGAAPVMGKLWPGFLIEGGHGILVPAGTPPERVRQLNRDINRALAEPEVQTYMRESGQDPAGGSVQAYRQQLEQLAPRYQRVIEQLGLGER